MIDIESKVYSSVRAAILAKYPKCYVADAILNAPPSYPCVYIVEADNTNYRRTADSSGNEHDAEVLYVIEIYSNKVGGVRNGKVIPGKKAECKDIAAIADDTMLELGFNRTMLNQIPNEKDATIYRMVGRYNAKVSKDGMIFGGK